MRNGLLGDKVTIGFALFVSSLLSRNEKSQFKSFLKHGILTAYHRTLASSGGHCVSSSSFSHFVGLTQSVVQMSNMVAQMSGEKFPLVRKGVEACLRTSRDKVERPRRNADVRTNDKRSWETESVIKAGRSIF